jgi:WD40-like Beta Propeller Repeat
MSSNEDVPLSRSAEHVVKGAKMRIRMKVALVGALVGAFALVAAAQAANFSAWGTAQKIDEIGGNHSEINTPFQDGCPIQSPDGLSLYQASNRPGGEGGLDIWVSHRESTSDPWGAPRNLRQPVNSASDEFCPTPVRGGGLFFVSREALPGSCGLGDIYFTKKDPVKGWKEPRNLGCAPGGPNTALDEQGPSYVEKNDHGFLFFSSSSTAVLGDINVSPRLDRDGWYFGGSAAVAGLNDAAANDIQPNVRQDGLEVVFSSNRAGGLGAQDIWASTRDSFSAPWSAPVNLGPAINTAAAESRPSLSKNARQLLFGRAPGPEGFGDIYVSTRTRN